MAAHAGRQRRGAHARAARAGARPPAASAAATVATGYCASRVYIRKCRLGSRGRLTAGAAPAARSRSCHHRLVWVFLHIWRASPCRGFSHVSASKPSARAVLEQWRLKGARKEGATPEILKRKGSQAWLCCTSRCRVGRRHATFFFHTSGFQGGSTAYRATRLGHRPNVALRGPLTHQPISHPAFHVPGSLSIRMQPCAWQQGPYISFK